MLSDTSLSTNLKSFYFLFQNICTGSWGDMSVLHDISSQMFVYYKNIDTALHGVFNVLLVQLKDQYIANI